MKYLGKELEEYDLWKLGEILSSLIAAEKRREEASKHPKFEKMEFPSPNPEFVKLKTELEAEIKRKQNA